jgi:hypothetical protein
MHTEGDERDARLWELAENLHRAELTVLERDLHVAEWVQLVSDKTSETSSPKNGRPGASAAASRELGVSERDVQRAVKVATLPEVAQDTAREVGLDNNRSALLAAGKAADPAAELRRLRAEKDAAEAAKHDRNADRIVRRDMASEFASWLRGRSDDADLPLLVSWLEGAKPKDVIACLRREAA